MTYHSESVHREVGEAGMEVKNSHGRLEIELPEIVDILAAGELQTLLLDALAREGEAALALRADRVARLSTAAIQVILAAAGACAKADRPFTLTRPAVAVAEAFARLGLTEELKKIT